MKIELELEVVTPLIMSGADQKEFELREMSINGAMRYWYRKLYGVGKEREIFGDNSRKGKFRIRIIDDESLNKENVKNLNTRKWFEGRNYLLGLITTGRALNRDVVVSGNFKLSLNCMKCFEDEWKHLLGSLWASIYIGGWGTRSRRGFGSLRVIKGEDVFIPHNARDFYKEAFETFEFKDEILEIYVVDSFNERKFINTVQQKTAFYNGDFKKPSRKLGMLEIPSSDPMDCLDLLGGVMQYFRAYLLPDYKIAKNAAQNNKESLNRKKIWRSDFGTPIMFRFREVGSTSVRDRIPSRLFLRVLKTPEGCYPVLIVDKSRPRVSSKDRDKPDDLIRVFLDVLSSSGAKKVIP